MAVQEHPSELPFLSTIGLMLTYKCNIACPHCIVEAGPHRKEEVLLGRAIGWVEEIKAYRSGHIKGLALTGGEPFLDLDRLIRISSHAGSMGLVVSAVSNTFWAETREAAVSTLRRVPDLGLISFSTDAYHQRSIPFRNVENAVLAARALDRRYNIAVCTHNEDDPEYRRILEQIDDLGESDNIRLSITFPLGRAEIASRRFDYQTETEPTVSACSMAGSPVVFPDGRVIACIGPALTLTGPHPMILGNLMFESLAEILDRAEHNPILHAVRVWGPHKLVSLLRQSGHERELPDDYLRDCVCDPCYRLLADRQLVDALAEMFDDDAYRKILAYARLYYLNESTMADEYGVEALAEPIDATAVAQLA